MQRRPRPRLQPVSVIDLTLIVVAIALIVVAILDAPLTWDGGYYLFHMLDTGEPMVAHDRFTDYLLHLPVVWTMHFADSQAIVRLVFNVIHVSTPIIALALSWWMVRRDAPVLFVWPTLGIGLALLPGQINFISEGIKSEQLMWPLLLAIVLGLPRRTWLLVIVLIPVLTLFHPVAVPIFFACALAAVVHAWLQPAGRARLAALAVMMIALASWRLTEINSSYESQEMTWETQQRQWSNSVAGAPLIALVVTALLAISILLGPFIPVRWHQHQRKAQLVAVLVTTVSLMLWAIDPARWWEALEYRGPALAVTLLATGALFLASLMRLRRRDVLMFDPRLPSALLIGFSLVIVVQSIAWNGVVRDMRGQLTDARQACVAREDLAGYPFTPLNLWSTNAFSLLYQGRSPEKISMRAADCHTANTTGEIFVSDSGSPYRANRFDFQGLHASLPNASVCTWRDTLGWYQMEALIPDTWRWTEGTGSIEVTMEEPGMVLMRGEFRTLQAPNTILVLVENAEFGSFEVNGLGSEPFAMTPVPLPAGTSTISFVSDNASTVVPNDDRLLAISVWNLTIHPADGSSPCIRITEPAGYNVPTRVSSMDPRHRAVHRQEN